MTVDEELVVLESQLRRLKIEYEVFFSNPQKKPPSDLEWKVLALLRKFSDGARLSFSQRFRYNEMAQRYAVYSDLWRKKSRIREEGYRRPQDALLSVQGVRIEEHEPEHKVYGINHAATAQQEQPFVVHCSDAGAEREKVEKLFIALSDAKKKTGGRAGFRFAGELHVIRAEEDGANPQTARLPSRRVQRGCGRRQSEVDC